MPASSAATGPKRPMGLLSRHWQAFLYVLTVILPIILRTGKRPVIFSKYTGIGDIVCTFPAALELKKRHPGVEFIYNCHPEFTCLPRLGGITAHTTSLISIGLVGHWYRFLLAGFYHFASDDDHPGEAFSETYIENFGSRFGLTLPDAHPQLHLDSFVLDRANAILASHGFAEGPFIAIHTGPTLPVKEWPMANWDELVVELRRHGFEKIIVLGTDHHLIIGAVKLLKIPGTLSLVNELSLEETAAVISRASLFIGVDSGLLHLAAALKIPSVGLWGATSPGLLFSAMNRRFFITSTVECQGCHHRFPRLHWNTGCPYDIKCMQAIEVPVVLQACLNALSERPANQPG